MTPSTVQNAAKLLRQAITAYTQDFQRGASKNHSSSALADTSLELQSAFPACVPQARAARPCLPGRWDTKVEFAGLQNYFPAFRRVKIGSSRQRIHLVGRFSSARISFGQNARSMKKHFDSWSLSVIVLTLILFAVALIEKGFTHDLLLEAGVFLVSAKLVLMSYRHSLATITLEQRVEEILQLLRERDKAVVSGKRQE